MIKKNVSEYAGRFTIVNTSLFSEGYNQWTYLCMFINEDTLIYQRLEYPINTFASELQKIRTSTVQRLQVLHGKTVLECCSRKVKHSENVVGFLLNTEYQIYGKKYVHYWPCKNGPLVSELVLFNDTYDADTIYHIITSNKLMRNTDDEIMSLKDWIKEAQDLYAGNIEYMLNTVI